MNLLKSKFVKILIGITFSISIMLGSLLYFILYKPFLIKKIDDKTIEYKLSFPVDQPARQQAIYGKLESNFQSFRVSFKDYRELKFFLLKPTDAQDIKYFSAEITGPNHQLYGILDGENYSWKNYQAPFDNKQYLKGPEFKQNVAPGDYEIKIFNGKNLGKYVLVLNV